MFGMSRLSERSDQVPTARTATLNDLAPLLELFRDLFAAHKVSRHAEPREKAETIWARTLARDGLTVFVSEADSRLVATCMLLTAPNLLRSGRQHGIIENVATILAMKGAGMAAP